MSNINSFKDLSVWQKSMSLAKDVYEITRSLPKSEEYGLSSQIRRSAVSIPSNIAEGSKRGSTKDFCQFLRMAQGSAAELETQLLLLNSIYDNIRTNELLESLLEVQKMLSVLIKRLSNG